MRRSMLSISISRILGLLVLPLLVPTLTGSTARANEDERPRLEEPRSRQGYWIGVGMSGLVLQAWEKGRSLGVYNGYTGTFRIGQLLSERLGLGLVIEYPSSVGRGSDKGSLYGLTLEGSCLLWRNLSVHAGFGLGVVLLKNSQALDPSTRSGGGSYALLGASYDLFPLKARRTGGWAVTPTVDLHGSADGDIRFLAVLAGVQVTWWSGLPDSMLQLPEE
jgi:hypothetical protein